MNKAVKATFVVLLSLSATFAQHDRQKEATNTKEKKLILDAESDLLPKPGECGRVNLTYLEDINGELKWAEYPWVGHAIFPDVYMTFCQVVLISKRYALSIAICYLGRGVDFYIVFGNWKSGVHYDNCRRNSTACPPGVAIYNVEDVGMHPQYDRLVKNDFALLRIATDVTFSDNIQPICLPTPELARSNFIGQVLYFGGSGYNKKREKPNKLKKLVQVRELERCMEKLPSFWQDRQYEKPPEMINCIHCVVGSCYSEFDGAPLMAVNSDDPKNIYYYIAGMVMAVGMGSSGDFWPSIKVPMFLEWIKDNMY